MTEHFIFYVESNIVCLVLFGIMLVHDLLNADRQEKQIKYDRALVSFMLYFISDIFLTAVNCGVLPFTRTNVVITNFADFLLMAGITFNWLNYAVSVEQVRNRNAKLTIAARLFPFAAATLALIVLFIAAPRTLINDAFEAQPVFFVLMTLVPAIYICAVLFYSIRKARTEKNPADRKMHLQIGMLPLLVLAGGIVEVFFFPDVPIFCFCCTVLMLIFYIKSMESQISMDSLTKLNNRGQLMRYSLQTNHLYKESFKTFVIMFDVNDFKSVNDTYGHAEGDTALVIVSSTLRKVFESFDPASFLCRYGGDEFVAIVHAKDEEDLRPQFDMIRSGIKHECAAINAPYSLSVSIGCSLLGAEPDSVSECIRRADEKLYEDKAKYKARSHRAA